MNPDAAPLVHALASLERALRDAKARDPDDERDDDVIRRKDKVIVAVRIVFLKIGEIDTLRERFHAEVFVQAKWEEPAFRGLHSLVSRDVDWSSCWKPRLQIDNLIGQPSQRALSYSLSFAASGVASVTERLRLTGEFSESLELQLFPFDTQDLTITVSSCLTEAEVELLQDVVELSGVDAQSFAEEQEWSLRSELEFWTALRSDPFEPGRGRHPTISVACRATRRPGYFIWNILIVLIFLGTLAFTTFSVETSLPQNRLQLSFLLLLTTITFKFVVNQSLPRISYLTMLDKYILGCMAIMCLICMWHSIVGQFMDRRYAFTLDNAALIVLAFIFVAFNAVFFVCLYMRTMSEESRFSSRRGK